MTGADTDGGGGPFRLMLPVYVCTQDTKGKHDDRS